MAQPVHPDDRYRELYENMPVMYFEMDDQGVVIRVNDFGAGQLGYRADEILGKSVLNVFHEDDRARVEEQFGDLIRTEGVAAWEFRKRRKDGSVLWVSESARAIRGAEGRMVVMVVCQDVTDRKRVEEENRESEKLVRQLTQQLGEAQERERRRIAVHLHEDVGQTLALAHLRLGRLAAAPEIPIALEEVKEVKQLIQNAIVDTRSLTFELASPVLYELGLAEALRALCDRNQKNGKTRFQFDCSDDSIELSERISVPIYRIASELVFNIRKHAEAERAWVSLDCRNGSLLLTIKDDGKGFDPEAFRGPPAPGIGLFSIEQRLDFLGGKLEIQSTAGAGTHITVQVELKGEP